MTVEVLEVGPEHARAVTAAIHAAFAARPALDPPSTALEETLDSVAAALAEHGGLLATADGHPVGALLFAPAGDALGLRRVAVVPDAQRRGVALLLARAAEQVAVRRGLASLTLMARAELPGTVAFWLRAGYEETSREGTSLTMTKPLPRAHPVPTAEAMRELGRRLAGLLRAGDLLILSGDLGAGKTTFTQGLGAGLGVRGDVTSPTFVISRIHPSLTGGPGLVHVDAYRLGGLAELDDLDLDVSLDDSVTVVEWGEGIAEGLAEERLEVRILRTTGADPAGADEAPQDGETRTVTLVPVGSRWASAELERLADDIATADLA